MKDSRCACLGIRLFSEFEGDFGRAPGGGIQMILFLLDSIRGPQSMEGVLLVGVVWILFLFGFYFKIYNLLS